MLDSPATLGADVAHGSGIGGRHGIDLGSEPLVAELVQDPRVHRGADVLPAQSRTTSRGRSSGPRTRERPIRAVGGGWSFSDASLPGSVTTNRPGVHGVEAIAEVVPRTVTFPPPSPIPSPSIASIPAGMRGADVALSMTMIADPGPASRPSIWSYTGSGNWTYGTAWRSRRRTRDPQDDRGKGHPAHPSAPARRVLGGRRRRRDARHVRPVPADTSPRAATGSTTARASGRWGWRVTARSTRATSRGCSRTGVWVPSRRGPRGPAKHCHSSCPAAGTSRSCPSPCSWSIRGSSSRASRTRCPTSWAPRHSRPRRGASPSPPERSTPTWRPGSRSSSSASCSRTSRLRSRSLRSAALPAPPSPGPSRPPPTAQSSSGLCSSTPSKRSTSWARAACTGGSRARSRSRIR